MKEKFLQVRASTIVESLVALVIVSIIFSVSGGIYMKVVSSRSSIVRMNANNEIRDIVSEIKSGELKPENENITGRSFDLQIQVQDYREIRSLKLLSIVARDKKGRVLASWRELVCINQEENEN